ncbi:TetR/AcrR family transcriptional regulator [Sphingobacterium sp. Mn56C]|uniref:TetR/AcrR family transcriptional regulator n=1 Tax=Sphingobacterium sp. Mn56C TaxID=3395261 RepID=UPI003BDEF9B2
MDKRKEEIIEVALKRFSHYGFSKTTMNEIAEDLHITKANLYYYYQDKSALIKDSIYVVGKALYAAEEEILSNYSGDFMDTVFKSLELRASFMRRYYMLHINENLEWIKGVDIAQVMEEFLQRDIQVVKRFFTLAVEAGDLVLEDIEEASIAYVEISKSISFMHNAQDIITGIPNKDNVTRILESQKRAAQLIFEKRIVTHTK